MRVSYLAEVVDRPIRFFRLSTDPDCRQAPVFRAGRRAIPSSLHFGLIMQVSCQSNRLCPWLFSSLEPWRYGHFG